MRPGLLAAVLTASCATEADSGVAAVPSVPQDIQSADLELDVSTLQGRATVVVRPAARAEVVKLDVSGLTVASLSRDGEALDPVIDGGWLLVPVLSTDPVSLEVGYTFPERTEAQWDGWMPSLGVSFIWPYFCGNLYPCNPDLRDGLRFSMVVTGAPEGTTAVYATDSVGDAPPYMPGFAIGAYERLDLGTTAAGTRVAAWYSPLSDGLTDAEAGTAHLRDTIDFFETTYGAYAYGPEVGSVEVNWGSDSWGGMEHHPWSHVARWDFGTEEVHAHEAAHGWFGDAVRMQCWEDFVLSEGTVTYMAARAMETTGGPDLWAYYVDDFLEPICGRGGGTVVLPDQTCNDIDMLESDLWSLAPYMKGACFYEEVADVIGVAELDAIISGFYGEHVGGAARMQDMLDAIEAATDPADHPAIEAAAEDWLRAEACPVDYAARCRSHGNAPR